VPIFSASVFSTAGCRTDARKIQSKHDKKREAPYSLRSGRRRFCENFRLRVQQLIFLEPGGEVAGP
jgi:hypothetical protein